MKFAKGQRVDAPAVADRRLHCLVCKGEIGQGQNYWESGTTNKQGVIEYWVFLHPECLSLLNASLASRVAA